ncbi:MAG: NAD-dependent protein deacetylase [Myxococcota bacterium]
MTLAMVPDPDLNVSDAAHRVAQILRGQSIVVLSGAGISTESGIPDYRGPETGRRARNPIPFNRFIGDPAARSRYWARASVGWARVAEARPNPAHDALAQLEAWGHIEGLITQNVDRLHHRAGSHRVVELHGTLDEVRCLGCEARESRTELQKRLLRLNPGWTAQTVAAAPDGDAELESGAEARFRTVGCLRCGGALKPDVVFFGEPVPRPRVERSYAWVDRADALLVVGSSLTVFSGFRFVKRAHKQGKPIVILNVGPTRGDALATLKIEGRVGAVLPAIAEQLAGHSP